jgi:hypothetical protein
MVPASITPLPPRLDEIGGVAGVVVLTRTSPVAQMALPPVL